MAPGLGCVRSPFPLHVLGFAWSAEEETTTRPPGRKGAETMMTQMKVSGVGKVALLAAALFGGCAADESATGDRMSPRGEADVASVTSPLAVGAPVAWKNAAGTVTGINTAALRADFPD